MIHVAKKIWYCELNGYSDYLINFSFFVAHFCQFKGATTPTKKSLKEKKLNCVNLELHVINFLQ